MLPFGLEHHQLRAPGVEGQMWAVEVLPYGGRELHQQRAGEDDGPAVEEEAAFLLADGPEARSQ